MMKYLQHLLVLFGTIVIFFSCQKEYSVENNGPGTNIGTSQWEFKDSTGTLLKGPVDTAYIDSVGPLKYLTIEGVSADGRDFITLQVYGTTLAPGAYRLPNSTFDYIRNGVSLYQSDPTLSTDFNVTITAIDTAGVTGTFNGKVKDANNVLRTITAGKFAGKFKKSSVIVPPPPPVTDSGQAMLWSKAGCGGGASTTPIAVSVSTKTGQITSFTATEPTACGVAGAFTVKLAVGSYTWKAKCGADSISGSVAVTKNGCTKVEVNFANPPQNCKLERIYEINNATGKAEYSYVSFYDASNKVIKVDARDSSTNTVLGIFPITYPTATRVQVDANQYFLLDASNRIMEFHGFEDITSDTTDKVTLKYSYNASGQLIKRVQQYDALPGVDAIQTDFTYTGANLTTAVIKVNTGTNMVKALDVTYEYDASKTVKNFIYMHAFAFEIFYFQAAVNAGSNSINPVTKITTRSFVIATGSVDQTAVTNLGNYVIDANNYVQNFQVTGDDYQFGLLYSGYKYNLKYKCF